MLVKDDWLSLRKAQKWVWGVVTPALFITSVSLGFIWVYLFRIGRQDLFQQAISLKDFSPVMAVFSILSIIIYVMIFFMQSFVFALILRRKVVNFSGYSNVKRTYLTSFIGCSFVSPIIFYLITFYLPNLNRINNHLIVFSEFILMALMNVIICYSCNKTSVNKKTLYMTIHESKMFKFKFHVMYPALLGVASWMFVFPMGLIFKYIDFPPDAGLLIQVLSLFALTLMIIFFSLLPGITYHNLPLSMKISHQFLSVTASLVVSIMLSSVIAPVIPVQIVNLSMRLSGATNFELSNYAVSKDNYPIEMFVEGNWKVKDSNNKKMYIFTGFSMFAVGPVKLVCPEETSGVIEKSMKFRLFDTDHDNELRKELAQATGKCNVLTLGEFKSWHLNAPYKV